jgi:hypothetical protein
MPIYQNQYTNTLPLASNLIDSDGFDFIQDHNHLNWISFIDASINSKHKDRKVAFQEFIYIMLYYRNRAFNGFKFPHNHIYSKVLKYFVDTEYNTTQENVNAEIVLTKTINNINFDESFKSPKNIHGEQLFVIDSLNNLTVKPKQNILSKLPKLSDDSSEITKKIRIALSVGHTTIGFFQETATLFAQYYLMKQLTTICGHTFQFDKPLLGLGHNYQSKIVEYDFDNDVISNNSIILSNRTNNIINNVNKPKNDLPYFFNSLVKGLLDENFLVSFNNLNQGNEEKMWFSYFIRLLDPVRPLGVFEQVGFHGNTNKFYENWWGTTNFPNVNDKVAIKIINNIKNDFLSDLLVTILSGNGVPDFNGNINTNNRPFVGQVIKFSNNSADKVRLIDKARQTYEKIRNITLKVLEYEVFYMMRVLYPDSKKISKNVILASGIGQTSTSILSIQDFGLPYFNYDISNGLSASMTNITPKPNATNEYKIDLNENHAMHLGVYALDLENYTQNWNNTSFISKFKISLVLLDKKGAEIWVNDFKFKFVPSKLGASNFAFGGQSIVPEVATNQDVIRFYHNFSLGGTTTSELIAEYYKDNCELILRKFTTTELDRIGLRNIAYLKFQVESGKTNHPTSYTTINGQTVSQQVCEELLTLVSFYNDEKPSFFIDDVLFGNDTFQLYIPNFNNLSNLLKEQLKTNKKSYDTLVMGINEKLTLKYLFDLLRLDANQSNSTLKVVEILPPILRGSYIGEKNSGNNTSEKIVPNKNVKPKFVNGANPTSSDNDDLLRYSRVKLEFYPNKNFPNIADKIQVRIDIKSFVSPSPSYLYSKISQTSESLNKYNELRPMPASMEQQPDYVLQNVIANNQILAMMRSFGLLEGIVNKIIYILYTFPDYEYTPYEKLYIKNQILQWLPPPESTEANLVICIDEVYTTPPFGSLLAPSITLNDYYLMKNDW